MMPKLFPEANVNMQPPAGVGPEECATLPVWTDGTQCISCWQPSRDDIEAIQAGKPIWLRVMGGQPPVSVDTEYPFMIE